MLDNNSAKHTSELNRLLLDETFEGEVLFNEPASLHTTYQCGGPFRYFITVDSIFKLQQILLACDKSNIKTFVIGKGSNLLVSDDGFDGVVISLGADFRNLLFCSDTSTIVAGAGVSLAKVSQLAYNNDLSGLEFSVGIPGTIGGALGMNAGTEGVGLCDVVSSVSILDKSDGYKLKKIQKSEFDFDYHTSKIADLGVAVECEIPLKVSKTPDLKIRMDEKLKRRNDFQPLGHNCGSVFKNPEGESAGSLIEKCGLKGKRCGGAEISEMHANFFTNVENAKSSDIMSLIKLAQGEVFEKFGIKLEPEVKFLGF